MNKKYLYTGTILLCSYFIYKYIKKQYNLILDYCYKIINIEFKKISKDTINLELKILFKNISNINYSLNKLSVDIYIENYYFGKVYSNNINTISNKEVEAIFDINISLLKNNNLSNILSLLFTKYLFDKDNINFKFILNTSVKINIFNFNIPINIKNYEIIETYKSLKEEKPSNCKI